MTDLLARFGYLARGVLYVTIGFLAGRAAVAARAERLGPSDALRVLLREPHGRVFLEVLAAGFLSYALFSIAEMSKKRSRGMFRRISHAAAAAGSLALAVLCLRLLGAIFPGRPVDLSRRPIARLVARPWGRDAVIAVGAVILLAGAVELYRGLAGRFRDRFVERRMGRFERRWAVRVTRFGLASHAVLLLTIGFLAMRTGLTARSVPAISTGGAIFWLSNRPHGAVTLAVLAAGLACYGFSLFVLALYRRKS